MKTKFILTIVTVVAVFSAPVARATLVDYDVELEFMETAYGGYQNTYFFGSFTYDTEANSIHNLSGKLSEAMTGVASTTKTVLVGEEEICKDQICLDLQYNPVASRVDGKGGITAHAFLLDTTSIYAEGSYDTSAMFKKSGIANAYATIYVTPDQLNGINPVLGSSDFGHLYYGDCQPGGMMGPICMTAWGTASSPGGSMGGYVLSEKVMLATPASVPLPPAIWAFLTGLIGLLSLGRRQTAA